MPSWQLQQVMRSRWADHALSIAATAAAVLLRRLLDPWLGDALPFVTLFGAVAASVVHGGWLPGLLSTALGFLACDYLFMEPRGTIALYRPQDYIGLILYLFTCSIIIGLGEAMRHARRRTDEQRELLRVTFLSMGDAVIATDAEARLTSLNPVAAALTGWTEDDARGRRLDEVFHIVNEHTRQPAPNPVSTALAEGNVVGLANHTTLIARDGAERPIDDSAAPIRDAAGRVRGAVLIFRDITERRQAELTRWQLAAIVESSDDAILSKDLNGIVTSWNQGAERLYGYAAEEIVGKPVALLIPPDRPNELPAIMERLKRGERIEQFETVRQCKDGRRIDVAVSVSPAKDEAGRLAWASVIARDITDRKRAEAQLRDSDRRKDEFLATLAHELRNPLAPVVNSLELMKQADGDLGTIERARTIAERQVAQMVRLIDDLLDVSRIARGKLELRTGTIELAPVLADALETCRHLSQAGDHEWSIAWPSEPIFLQADAARLAQVFANLLANACKYTPRHGRISVAVERQQNEALVRVADNGIGIPTDMLLKIFDPFVQVGCARERSKDGLGIGLSLVKRLVEMHGGSVSAHSQGPDQGSEFVVRLPALAPDSASQAAPPAAPTQQPAAPSVSKHRILLVDDNRDAAASMAMLLKLVGHETHVAYDGAEALEQFVALSPDVVLLDIGLPKLDGYEVCRAIRATPAGRAAVIVALTGWGQDDDRRKSQEAGFDGHLVKPVDQAALGKFLSEPRHPAAQ